LMMRREQLGPWGPQTVVLDARDSQLQVQRISEELTRLIGAGPGSKFVRYVQNSRGFKSWIHMQLRASTDLPVDWSSDGSNSSLGGGTRSRSKQVRLRPRGGSAHWHFCATCTCLFNDETEFSGDAESPLPVQIELRDITRLPGGFRSTRIQSDLACSDLDRSSSYNSGPSSCVDRAEGTPNRARSQRLTASRVMHMSL